MFMGPYFCTGCLLLLIVFAVAEDSLEPRPESSEIPAKIIRIPLVHTNIYPASKNQPDSPGKSFVPLQTTPVKDIRL
jgi:hypothetical protein